MSRERVSVVTITCPRDGRLLSASVRLFNAADAEPEIDIVDAECGPAFANTRCPSHPHGPYLWNVRADLFVARYPGEREPKSDSGVRGE